MKRVAVFCGSSDGASPEYIEYAIQLGEEIAKRGLTLVYGGATIGLMGHVANTVLCAGGEVIGVMPRLLHEREITHSSLTELYVVDTMHERKAKMAELADAFIILPGGPGTMEEFFEIFTWAQIGVHEKPFGLLNIRNYYDPLLTFFEQMIQEKFMLEKYRSMLIVENIPGHLFTRFESFIPPEVKTYD